MLTFRQIKKYASPAAIVAGVSTFASSAMAAVPEAVTTEITGAKTDVGTVGAAVFGVAVAIVIFKWFRRAL